MKAIELNESRVLDALERGEGAYLVFPAKVDWPELQLTEGQMLANAFAHAYGQPAPYDDPSFIEIRIRRGR